MNEFTVVGLYSNDWLCYTGHHVAATPEEAANAALATMGSTGCVIAVIAGQHNDLLHNEYVYTGEDNEEDG